MKSRFAPSPTGLLHLGNIYSALQCFRWAKKNSASLILRIEDIDFTRCKPEFTIQILDDLAWIGLSFDDEVTYQNKRMSLYQGALDRLVAMGALYPCFCTRKQVAENTIKPKSTQLDTYPQTCLNLSQSEIDVRKQKETFSWRLNSNKALGILSDGLFWLDNKQRQHHFNIKDDIGDVIIGRKDIHFSYHLAVVVDDALQCITHVIRGDDLKTSTPVHRVLQLLLGYDSPIYIHHKLIQDKQGERLAKSKGSPTLKSLRDIGCSPQDVLEHIERLAQTG